MKKNLLFGFIGAIAVLVLINLTAFKTAKSDDEKPWKYILVEIYEIPSYNDSGVHIHWGNGKTDIIPFKPFTAENHDDNGNITLKALNDLADKGYHVTHVAAGLAQSGMITKIFMTTKNAK